MLIDLLFADLHKAFGQNDIALSRRLDVSLLIATLSNGQ